MSILWLFAGMLIGAVLYDIGIRQWTYNHDRRRPRVSDNEAWFSNRRNAERVRDCIAHSIALHETMSVSEFNRIIGMSRFSAEYSAWGDYFWGWESISRDPVSGIDPKNIAATCRIEPYKGGWKLALPEPMLITNDGPDYNTFMNSNEDDE